MYNSNICLFPTDEKALEKRAGEEPGTVHPVSGHVPVQRPLFSYHVLSGRQCKTKKEIYVSIRSYNEMVFIRVENTVEKYGGSILYRQKNGKLYSDVLLNR